MVWFNKHSEEFDNAAAIEKLKNSLDTCMSSFQKAKVLFPLQLTWSMIEFENYSGYHIY